MGTILLLFGAGLVILIAELFLPSHGVLTVMGLGFVIAGIVMTFRAYGQTAGVVSVIATAIALPTFGLAAIRLWPRTWIGKKIAPPNPPYSSADSSVPVADLSRYIGRVGRTVSPLRPVGVCDFDGRRISCIAEYGILDAGVAVEGLRVSGGDLTVREKKA